MALALLSDNAINQFLDIPNDQRSTPLDGAINNLKLPIKNNLK